MATRKQLQKIRVALKKIKPLLIDSRKRDLNETETANVVERLIETVLGYDLFKEVSAEEAVGSKAADYAIKLRGKRAFIMEVKRIQSKLKDRHVYQVKNYAANLGVPWCVLTNGIVFRLYHITFSESLRHDLVFEANLVDDPLEGTVAKLWFLTRKGILKKELDAYWRKKRSLSEEGILGAVMSLGVLRAIRREIRKESGETISEVEIARALKRMLAEEMYSQYEKLTKKVRRQRKRKARERKKAKFLKRAPTSSPQRPPGAAPTANSG